MTGPKIICPELLDLELSTQPLPQSYNFADGQISASNTADNGPDTLVLDCSGNDISEVVDGCERQDVVLAASPDDCAAIGEVEVGFEGPKVLVRDVGM